LPLYGVFVISVCQSVANLAENIWSSQVNFIVVFALAKYFKACMANVAEHRVYCGWRKESGKWSRQTMI
jgi:hypothetical protein